MWCSYHTTTTHRDVDCRARPANTLNGNVHFAQVGLPNVPGICSSWAFPVRDKSHEKPCISFLAREVQSATKSAKAQAEEKGPRPFGPASRAATEGWRSHPWSFTPRAKPSISSEGPVAEEKSNLCYTFGMANDDEPVEKALMASSSVDDPSDDSINSNLATLMEDSGASGHYFDDAIIRYLKQRRHNYTHLTTPRKIITTGGAMLQGLVTDDNGNQVLVRVGIVVVSCIGRSLFSVMTAAKNSIATIFDHKTPGWRDSTSL